MRKVHVVPHCHWDREWYFTVEDSSALLIAHSDYLVDMLEQNQEFKHFVLDGQMAVVDNLLELNSKIKDKFTKLVNEDRIAIGPMYSQCDTQVIKLESLIRNLELGKMQFEQFEKHMPIGYLPDCFGQNAYLPSLFKEFNLEYSIFQRGLLDEELEDSLNFNWLSPDGQSILTNNIFNGYGLGKFLSDDDEYLNDFLLPILDARKDEVLLVPAGGDQYPPDTNLPKIIKSINGKQDNYFFELSNYENYMDEVESSKEISGELIECQKSRIHRTMHSSRMDIKIINTRLEKKIIQEFEPLYVMYTMSGYTIDDSVYSDIWKKLLVIQGHDGICSCNSDATNEDVKARLKALERMIDAKINILKKQIATDLELTNKQLLLFSYDVNNNMNKEITIFSDKPTFELEHSGNKLNFTVLDTELVNGGNEVVLTKKGEAKIKLDDYYKTKIVINEFDIDFGYVVVNILDTNDQWEKVQAEAFESIEVDNYQVDLSEGINIDGIAYSLEVTTDDGDSYDYSFIKGEKPLFFDKVENSTMIDYGNYLQILGTISVANQRGEQMDVEMNITLMEDDLKFKLNFNNELSDTRLRFVIKHQGQTTTSQADCGFSLVERENYQTRANELWEQGQMAEMPLAIYPFERGVQFGDYSIVNSSVTEYENKENQFYLTLFRSNEYLGKDDLVVRPGRASGINNVVVKTPKAQMLGVDFEIEFVITKSDLYKSYKRYTNNTDFYQLQSFDAIMNRVDRFMLKQSTVKPKVVNLKIYDGEEVFCSSITLRADKAAVRLFNPGETEEEVVLCSAMINSKICGDPKESKQSEVVKIQGKSYVTMQYDFKG